MPVRLCACKLVIRPVRAEVEEPRWGPFDEARWGPLSGPSFFESTQVTEAEPSESASFLSSEWPKLRPLEAVCHSIT